MNQIHGGITTKVAREKNTYAIYKTKNDMDDPNYDAKSYYKDTIIELVKKHKIKYLFDIHVMSNYRKEGICIGTGIGKNIFRNNDLLERMIDIFTENKFENITVDDPFDAKYKHTVCSTISRKCEIPCFQIEINSRYMYKKHDEYSFDNILKSLIEIVEEVENTHL